MARRLRLPSWVDDEPKRPASKPLPPLRHRISPAEKAFDQLDELERELNAQAATMDGEHFDHLANILAARRERIARRLERELEAPTTTPRGNAQKRAQAPCRPLKIDARPGFTLPRLSNKAWGLIVFVFLLAIAK